MSNLTTAIKNAKAAGFTGAGLVYIVAVDEYDGFKMGAGDYISAFTRTKKGTDFSAYPETFSINGGPSAVAPYLDSVAQAAGVPKPNTSATASGNSPFQNWAESWPLVGGVIKATTDNTAAGSPTDTNQGSILDKLGAAVQELTSPGTWIRVALFSVALLLVIVGFLILIHGNEVTSGGAT